jgi:hypothetical protein
MEKSKTKKHLLSVKFIGPTLETRSVPISDLGKTLLAFQQIIHKCYLYKEERLRPGAQLKHAEKNKLTLQIDEYSKGCDIFSFVPFLSDPETIGALTPIVMLAFEILGKVAAGAIQGIISSRKRNLASQMYNQLIDITRQINENISEIQIIHGKKGYAKIIIKKDTHKYLRTLASEEYHGDEIKIRGPVIRLDPMEDWVDIRDFNNKRIRVFLENRRDFRAIRHAKRNAVFEFTGKPLWKIGSDMEEISRFEASSINQLETEEITA